MKTNTPEAGKIREAVRKVLDDAKYREAARRIQEDFAKHKGADNVCEALEDYPNN